MTAAAPATVESRAEPMDAPPRSPRRRRWTRYVLPVYSIGVLVYLVLPILVMILYGFNNSGFKRVSFRWLGFTTEWYRRLFAIPDLTNSLKNSLIVATISTLIATALGTMMALALVRYRFRAKGTSEFVMFLNIAAPEIVLGASLLSLFITFGVPRGMLTIVIAHVMFNIAFVTICVRARLAGFDLAVEEAARDLGATPWVTFWKVTFPIIFPGILAGALLAFALSIDDFIITLFNAGSVSTFPLYINASFKVSFSPQVNVLATTILIFSVALLGAGMLWGVYREKRTKAI